MSKLVTKTSSIKEKLSENTSALVSLSKTLLFTGVVLYLGIIILSVYKPNVSFFSNQELALQPPNSTPNPTNISHLLFGLIGSEGAYHERKQYIESWWRPGQTRGHLYLDAEPTGDLNPWPDASPPFRVSDNIAGFIDEIQPVTPAMTRMVHNIMEVVRDDTQDFRWLIIGDDDSIFFVDNLVDVLAKYDHTKYYYFGAPSDFILSNFWFSFVQAFGGAGIIMSYPLAKALINDMDSCLRRTSQLNSADLIIFACIADIGTNLSPLLGSHQFDLHGDISGLLSSHPKVPLTSLHHLDVVEPIFPNMDRFDALRHLMKAAQFDQSRLLQQTICHQRNQSWTLSTSWGYSVYIYEKIMPRWWIQYPIQTFQPWFDLGREPPHYMFNTRVPSDDPCEAPHVFFFKSIDRISDNSTRTIYYRSAPRGLSPCLINGNHTADDISEIHVFSPTERRTEIDRCECCNVVFEEGTKKVEIRFRECMLNEVIA